ncbi:MAG: YeeE/YedE family protein [Syntrophobacterales bacterium]|nr:YeeE/YedE family protein [Syntrophobacterales bacterium]
MLSTFYGADRLDSPAAWAAAFILGVLFGLALERAGFGSSRRLAAVFYLDDLAVIKVMFTALVTAMLALLLLTGSGLLPPEHLFYLPTVYGAHLLGGLILGTGFAMGGWCPGTAAVGAASGKLDALLFLAGGVLGCLLYNELYPWLAPLAAWGEAGVDFLSPHLGLSQGAAAFYVTLLAVLVFWGCEILERRRGVGGALLSGRFLPTFSLALLLTAAVAYLVAPLDLAQVSAAGPSREAALLAQIEAGTDHIEPEELADRLLAREAGLVVADVRTEAEYRAFHLRGAIHAPLPRVHEVLAPYKNRGLIVLYSGGMTHAAQARDSLARQGFRNVYLLSEGLTGFRERVLKPASLREETPTPEKAARIRAWRAFFLAAPAAVAGPEPAEMPAPLPGLIETDWLARNLGQPWIKIIDLRSQPEYNTGHIPGAVYLSYDSLRGVVGGVSSMLLPAELLAAHFSLIGVTPRDLVVLIPGEKMHDATLVGMAAERLGHRRYAILQGGMAKWLKEKRPLTTALPAAAPSSYYPVQPGADDFTVDARAVLEASQQGRPLILDVRPAEYFRGEKSEEARAGHIPGARNRPFSEDVVAGPEGVFFKPAAELAAAYARLLPDKQSPVIVHCRTGHQASQTFFVLKRLLGYRQVKYYDAGWSEWASRPELPVAPGK